MLLELQIRNLALMKELSVSFGPGLNVITGESGSGKSVLIHALELVLGARAGEHLISAGADSLEVQALFRLSDLPKLVREQLPEAAQGEEELLLTRQFQRGGRNRVLINGKLGSVALLAETGRTLMSLCGQHEYVHLLDAGQHLMLLDSYGGLVDLRSSYLKLFREYQAADERFQATALRGQALAARQEELQSISAELEPLGLTPTLRAELEAEVRRISAAEYLLERSTEVTELVSGDQGLLGQARTVVRELSEWSRRDPAFSQLVADAQAIRESVENLDGDVRRNLRSLHIDEERLTLFRDRLAEVARCERKYKRDSAGLLDLVIATKKELEESGEQVNPAILAKERDRLAEECRKKATQLSKGRSSAARKLEVAIARELTDLGMERSKISVQISERDLGPAGIDAIELLLSSRENKNDGAPETREAGRPLKLVASGGELARLTLILKTLLREQSGVNVLVFDEVDTGISGRVARAVGEKLRSLAELSQVVCVTHLPQVASLANHHLLIIKKGSGATIADPVTGDRRVDEIARMLAGYEVTPAARASAKELIKK